MQQIIVTKQNGDLIHKGEYAGQEWLDQNINTNAWGKPERWLPDFLEGVETRTIIDQPFVAEHTVKQMQYDEEGNELGEIDVVIPEQPEISHTEYLHPAEYTYEIKLNFDQERAQAKIDMDEAIYTEAYNVFGTKDVQSMNAFAQSWALKRDNAGYYVNDGLIVTKAYDGFPLGMALDTEAKIQAYFTARCNDLITFDKFRDAQINAYLVKLAQYTAQENA